MPRRKQASKQRGGNARPPDKVRVEQLIKPTTTKKTALKGDALIRATFEDPATGLMSATKLHKNLRRIYPKITLKRVKDVLARQESVQINSEKRRPGYSNIAAPDIASSLQCDLLDLSKYKGVNRGYSWILMVVDIYSRYAWLIPLKNKKTPTVLKAFEQLFASDKKLPPKNITSDNGSEFINKQIQALFSKRGVKHWRAEPGDHHILGIIDRFSRTVRTMLRKWWAMQNTKQWIDVIDAIQDNYNDSVHRTIDARPADVWSGKAIPIRPKAVEVESFSVGDLVRKRVVHTNFEKKTERWSRDVYQIVRAVGRGYILKNTSTGHELVTKVKPDALLKVTAVDVAERKIDDSHVAAQQVFDAKTARLNKQAGVAKSNIIKEPRHSATRGLAKRGQARKKTLPKKYKDFEL